MERIIEIKGLELMVNIGVPEEERAHKQKLLIDVRFVALEQLKDLRDELSATVDYVTISQRLEEIAHKYPRSLIETLADDMTTALLKEFKLAWVELTIRKFILPNTEYVAVTVKQKY